MWSIIVKGGLVMVPLGICSVLALYVIVDRLIYFFRFTEDGWILLKRLRPLLSNGHWEEAKTMVTSHPSDAFIRILSKGMNNADVIRQGEINELKEAAQDELNHCQKGIVLLDTIVTAAPMLGLLGTVIGIIDSFQVLSSTMGPSTAQAISRGIAEALITTAAGLCIAIPSLFFLNYFQRRVEEQANRLSQFGQAVFDLIRGGDPGGTLH